VVRGADIENRARCLQRHHQLGAVEAAVHARGDLTMLGGQQLDGAGDHRGGLLGADPRAVGADEFAGQRASALRPRHDIRAVPQAAAMTASGALLGVPVDLGVRRVEIKRDVLAAVAAGLTVQALADARLRTLDRADVATSKPLGQLARRRRRRRVGDRSQRSARTVATDILDIVKAVRPGDLALRQRDHQRARRQAAPATLDRPRRAHDAKLRVDQLDQSRAARQRADDRKSRIRRQVRIVRADHKPSGARDIVIGVHPQGDASSPSRFVFTPRNLTVEADGKHRVCGAFHSLADDRSAARLRHQRATHRSRSEAR
jgi:hypothetical protein